MSDIDTSLIPDFVTEAVEHLEEMESGLLKIEADPTNTELLNGIFRNIHTIKGAAQFIGLKQTSSLSHNAENLLDMLRSGERFCTHEIVDVLIQVKDRLGHLLREIESTEDEQTLVDDLVAAVVIHVEGQDNGSTADTPVPAESAPVEPDKFVTTDKAKQEAKKESKKSSVRRVEQEPENYHEELDQELFSIFFQQLNDEMITLHHLLETAKMAEVPGPVVLDCITSLEKLKSSANYMGYDYLIDIYDDWVRALYECLGSDKIDWGVMDDYFEQIVRRFPALSTSLLGAKLDAKPVAAPKQESTSPPQKVQAQQPPTAAPKAAVTAPKVTTSTKATSTQTTKPIQATTAAPASATAPSTPAAQQAPAANNAALLAQLSAALEQSATATSSTDDDMDGIFEELTEIVEDDEFANSATPPKPSKPAESIKPAEHHPAAEEPKVKQAEPVVASEYVAEPQIAATATNDKVLEEELVQDETGSVETLTPALARQPAKMVANADSNAKNNGPVPGGEKTLKRSVRVDAEKIDTLMNQVGELIVHRSYFNQIQGELLRIQRHLDELGVDPQEAKALRTLSYRYSEAIVSLSRTANELQEGVMKVRMLPIAQLFNRYPRLVHDLVRHSEKKVRLEMRGEDTELDKMIIEEVSDPLIHIIRNAVDHGFETTPERLRLKKPETGTLVLEAYHESNHIVIKVTDDGRGIDPQKVAAKAIEKGLITEAELERMTPKEIMRLVMQPGFSTADAITNTSGRGVGMDVVRKNIEKLNGSVEIDSEIRKGTRFRLKIPLTLAIISALQVRVGTSNFTVPLANVEETLRVFEKETSIIEGVEVVQLRGHTMPIFRLAALFGIDGDQRNNSSRFFVVVVNTGTEKVGLVVDELLGQDEVVIKPLIDYLQEKSGFSGATIVGGGRISLILDVYELIKMTAHKQARFQQQLAVRRRQQMNQAHALLK